MLLLIGVSFYLMIPFLIFMVLILPSCYKDLKGWKENQANQPENPYDVQDLQEGLEELPVFLRGLEESTLGDLLKKLSSRGSTKKLYLHSIFLVTPLTFVGFMLDQVIFPDESTLDMSGHYSWIFFYVSWVLIQCYHLSQRNQFLNEPLVYYRKLILFAFPPTFFLLLFLPSFLLGTIIPSGVMEWMAVVKIYGRLK